jgi:hypothetical protein
MLNALIDFAYCNRHQCEVGGSEGTIPWKLYSYNPNGTRTLLIAPINKISEETDTEELKKRCDFFDRIIASKNQTQLVSIPFPTSSALSDVKIPVDYFFKMLFNHIYFWRSKD